MEEAPRPEPSVPPRWSSRRLRAIGFVLAILGSFLPYVGCRAHPEQYGRDPVARSATSPSGSQIAREFASDAARPSAVEAYAELILEAEVDDSCSAMEFGWMAAGLIPVFLVLLLIQAWASERTARIVSRVVRVVEFVALAFPAWTCATLMADRKAFALETILAGGIFMLLAVPLVVGRVSVRRDPRPVTRVAAIAGLGAGWIVSWFAWFILNLASNGDTLYSPVAIAWAVWHCYGPGMPLLLAGMILIAWATYFRGEFGEAERAGPVDLPDGASPAPTGVRPPEL